MPLISSSDKSYPDLDVLRDAYFEKYITNYDVTDFIRLIKFFDNSLFKMIKDFVPARSNIDTGLIIKPHLLERNKIKQVEGSFLTSIYLTKLTQPFPLVVMAQPLLINFTMN